jgi:predicted RNase H-like HicB family nuclease
MIHMETRFTAVFRKEGDWWAAYIEELPGANTQGRTLEEARSNLREAVELMLDVNRENAAHDAAGGDVIREELVVTSR